MEGDKEGAIETYLRFDKPVSKAMQRGSDFDKYCKDYIAKNKKLPPELGGGKLSSAPLPGHQITVPYNDMLDLKVEYDCLDDMDIIEIKNSTYSDSAEFANTLQLPIYFLASELQGLGYKTAKLYRYDPSRKEYDMTIIYRNKRILDKAKEAIEKYGPEIYEYFKSEGIL